MAIKFAAQDYPEQFVTKLCATLDIGGEVTRIHIGDAGNKGRSEEGQQAGKSNSSCFCLREQPWRREWS